MGTEIVPSAFWIATTDSDRAPIGAILPMAVEISCSALARASSRALDALADSASDAALATMAASSRASFAFACSSATLMIITGSGIFICFRGGNPVL